MCSKHLSFLLTLSWLLGACFALGKARLWAAEEGGMLVGGSSFTSLPRRRGKCGFYLFCTPFLNACKRLI